jgi:hypothetical protein
VLHVLEVCKPNAMIAIQKAKKDLNKINASAMRDFSFRRVFVSLAISLAKHVIWKVQEIV